MKRKGAALIGGIAIAFALAADLPPTPASTALAQTPGSGFATSYSENADKPIDIVADTLEVDDQKKVATFSGNVSATQGDFNLRARQIEVRYTPNGEENGESDNSSAVPGGGNTSISQIDAKGKVLITTKDDQTATSDWAVFDVPKQLVTIGGDVKLSQGENLIRGSRLIIDLKTGLSRFERPQSEDSGGKDRGVRMIFTPKNRSNEN